VNVNLMPIPQNMQMQDGELRLNDDFKIAITGVDDMRIFKGASRALRRLSGRTGLFFPQEFVVPTDKNAVMTINVNRIGKVKLGEDESYALLISSSAILLESETDIGALRGLETFLQLLQADKNGYFFPALKIEDAPRFPWRGLMIDASRQWQPVDVIKRNLDGMAAAKMNVLHWHLSEDQGFRVECKTFPKLHELGSDGFYYTYEQIQEVIDYAANRGIRVMPEFDIPGHSTAWFVGYPEYASAPGPYTIERRWGIMDPTFDPTKKETYEFFDAFFKEMCALFPDDYMHIGGDENNGKQWDANKDIQKFMKENDIKDNHELQSYFNKNILKSLTKYNKKMIGWDEILQPDSPKDIVIQSWRGKESLINAAKTGYNVLLSNGYYIDLIQPTDYHYLNDPLTADMELTPEQAKHILGGEATMWSEFTSPEIIDSRIWPRTAAIAERLWSPAEIKDVDDMYRRMDIISFQLEELGLTHEKNYEMMLRRLANNQDTAPVRTLVDIVEPLKIYKRGASRDFTQQSPYTRVMDAARADQKVAREFHKLVDQYLQNNAKDAELVERIKWHFDLWADNHDALMKIVDRSPVLREIESLSQDLKFVSLAGLEMINAIESGDKLTASQAKEFSKKIENAKKDRAQVELMIVVPVEKLLKYIK
jgi:hexosaminidase